MSALLEKGRSGETLGGFDIIDMHGHLGACPFAVPEAGAESLVKMMERIGVKGIIVAHTSCMYGHVEQGNRKVLEAMQAFPGRIMGYVVTWPRDGEEVRKDFERWFGAGFTGLKLHSANGFPYTEPDYAGALEAANERRSPVLLHTWGGEDFFRQLRDLAEKYPQCAFLLGHSGAIEAEEEEYTKAAREFENVYLELCMSRARRGLVEMLVEGAGVEKVVWGSDAVFLNQAQQIGKVLGARLSEGDKRAVLSDNARRILSRIQR